jgi:hypothetical protein
MGMNEKYPQMGMSFHNDLVIKVLRWGFVGGGLGI